ncbi:sigma 54 modulation/S30EA ribosomal C-terminal domain-containing protein [Streptomyces mirabilis]|jgi:ribosome-associated translation inhibitor RaiA|uniref:Sigma 54 modulation/S30EA ribosomal protein C terminus n=1 Tax=Streptomyces mirabilis TaxID=68239 RepID=A0A1I2XFS6_9ACTN|nr:sigma 54 modulation/S30EA ribosomal C-terminal domain-containing protein [Streptomyces mirabilis]SFH11869.1 Sigma 54 modulation/S30EA ribosomal protein C terminus [Streptomyces mirabilis]
MKRSAPQQAPEVQVETRGQLPPDAAAYARDKVRAVLGQTREPVLFARVRLNRTANPAVERPVIAQANVDLNGRPARAHVAGQTATQAVDLLQDRLAKQLARLTEHWEARRGRTTVPGPHEWRHGSEPTHRPDYYPRPVDERQVVRHKSFSLAWESPDEAAFELESMDYGFHLFTDADSGEDSVLYRSGATGYRLAQLHPHPHPAGNMAVPLTVSELPAPRMNMAEAQQRLEATGFPFVFFADDSTGRGNVLYHRYDGHYGLITPAE